MRLLIHHRSRHSEKDFAFLGAARRKAQLGTEYTPAHGSLFNAHSFAIGLPFLFAGLPFSIPDRAAMGARNALHGQCVSGGRCLL
jgi:hypothetical protein